MRKELDLYRSYRRRSRGETEGVWLRTFYLPAVAILLAGLCVCGVFKIQSHALQEKIAAQEQWMAEQEDRYPEAERKWADNEALMDRIAAAEDLTAALSTYPKITTELIAAIDAVGGERVTMTLIGYDSAGALQFRARSGQVIDIPAYILALRETDLFTAVDYSGYRYEQEGVYVLDLRCTLREGGAP